MCLWRETLRAVSHTSIWFWVAFNAGVFVALALDLVQFKHRGRKLSIRAATHRTLIWIGLSLLFNPLVGKIRERDKALAFLPLFFRRNSSRERVANVLRQNGAEGLRPRLGDALLQLGISRHPGFPRRTLQGESKRQMDAHTARARAHRH